MATAGGATARRALAVGGADHDRLAPSARLHRSAAGLRSCLASLSALVTTGITVTPRSAQLVGDLGLVEVGSRVARGARRPAAPARSDARCPGSCWTNGRQLVALALGHLGVAEARQIDEAQLAARLPRSARPRTRKKLISRVRPGVELHAHQALAAAGARCSSVDLPTLERPAKAISGGPPRASRRRPLFRRREQELGLERRSWACC